MSRRRQILLDCLLLFLGTAILVRPYFLDKYTDQWPSIESTFIADARFLAAHFPHPGWQPLWYTGTRFDYIYPPALPYGTAILSMVTGWLPVKAYHFYTIFFYCLGVAGVYVLSRVAGRARGFAILTGAAFALMSPCFLFIKDLRTDSSFLTPLRLGVLLRYGEGPHVTAFSLLPFALAFTWMSFERGRAIWVALAALCCGLVVSNNFYGATSLVFCYPVMVFSFWITRGRRGLIGPALAIPAATYGLIAFWFNPSYLSVTTYNLRYLPHNPATLLSAWLALLTITTYVCFTRKFAAARSDRTWAVFVIGVVLIFSLDVLGDNFWGFSLIGDPHRLATELDLVLILGSALFLEWLWWRRAFAAKIAARIVVCLLVAWALYSTKHYIRRSWHIVARSPDYTQSLEFRVADWVWKNMPGSRVAASGAVRFWFDAWHDLSQLGGGSDQGLLNPTIADAQWYLANMTDTEPTVQWMQALGVDAVYCAGPKSPEPYKDLAHQERFSTLPVLYDDGHDTRIYGIARRYRALARVVETPRIYAHPHLAGEDQLRDYIDTIENGPASPTAIEWHGSDEMMVRAHVDTGQSLLVQETWDPSWQAWDGSRRLPVRKDGMGFMVVDPAPGDRDIRLRFVTPFETWAGWSITALTVLILAFGIRRQER